MPSEGRDQPWIVMPRSLQETIDDESRKIILKAFFSIDTQDPEPTHDFHNYFEYYERELRHLRIGIVSSSRVISGLAAKTHEDIASICQVIKDENNVFRRPSKVTTTSSWAPRIDISAKLKERFHKETDLAIDRSVDLTVRLWLMINVRDEKLSVRTPHKPAIEWENGVSLESVIQDQFPCPLSTTTTSRRQARLSPSFNVATMVNICGLELKWTESLEDHLRLDRLGKVLWVFPYKDFLTGHLSVSTSRDADFLPPKLLKETIVTLNMLFPHWDSGTQTLLQRHKQYFHLMPPFHGPRRLDLNEFTYWRDRLTELYEEVYLAPPDSWRQLWVDRRNPHQYYTFWIALVVFALSLVSCVAGIVQAWASVRALNEQR